MWTQDHPRAQLSDYVLELLPTDERQRVDRHLQHCTACQKIVLEERALASEARKALLAVAQPSPLRLRQLAPQPPSGRQRSLQTFLRPALAYSLVLLLFVAGLQLYESSAAERTATSIAATATYTPTSTLAPAADDAPTVKQHEGVRSPLQPAGTPVALLSFAHN